MSLHISISANAMPIETVTCTRREDLRDRDETYTYDVVYMDVRKRRTCRAVIRHKYSEGSLVLVRKAVSEIAEIAAGML